MMAVVAPVAAIPSTCKFTIANLHGSQRSQCSVSPIADGTRSLGPRWCAKAQTRRMHLSTAFLAVEAPPPPPIDDDLHTLILDMGAEISDSGEVTTFGNDDEAVEAAESGVAVAELSHLGRLRVTGDDRIRFLHNQSTADFQSKSNGEGCDTVFVTSTARTIDLATAWVMRTAVILFVSANMREDLLQMLNKYIFFADKVEVEDITDKTNFFSIIGPKSDDVMRDLGLEGIVGKPYGSHMHYAVEGTPITVGVGCGLSEEGYSMLVSTSTAGVVWSVLISAGAVPMGSTAWERLRVLHGRPTAGKELVDEFNVLEAGLWKTVSLNKGCYIGQETVTRLITYDGVKQHLRGIQLEGPAEPGAIVLADGKKVGKITSCTVGGESGHFGLGYIRKQAGGVGLKVDVSGVPGVVVDVPFVSTSLLS